MPLHVYFRLSVPERAELLAHHLERGIREGHHAKKKKEKEKGDEEEKGDDYRSSRAAWFAGM